MSRSSFIFIATAFLTLPLAEIHHPYFSVVEAVFCLALIASFGIAHGAIDNHLYGFKNLAGNLKFIGVYLLVGAGFGALWYFQASIAFTVFMIISAYHFGQSQLVEELKYDSWWNRGVYTLWGFWLLASFLHLNRLELFELSAQDFEVLPVFRWMLENSSVLFYTGSGSLYASLLYSRYKSLLTWQSLWIEFYQIAIILVVFYFSSSLWGFTLYFVILHSGRVLQQEYQYLLDRQKVSRLFDFVKLLSPFTLVSIFGLAFIVAGFAFFQINYSYSLLALVFISCLTVPHSWVMDRFYQERN